MTYLNSKDPENNRDAWNNLEWYLHPEGGKVAPEHCQDLEMPKYAFSFHDAIVAYDKKEYAEAIPHFEKAVQQYYNSYDECLALCGSVTDTFLSEGYRTFLDVNREAAPFYKNVMKCKHRCEKDLNVEIQETEVTELPKMSYDYLQFAHYQVGNVSAAAKAATSSSLLSPSSLIAAKNLEYYSGKLGADQMMPFVEAKRFARIRKAVRVLGVEFERAWNSGVLDDSGEAELVGEVSYDAEDEADKQFTGKQVKKVLSPSKKKVKQSNSVESEENNESRVNVEEVNMRGEQGPSRGENSRGESQVDNKTETVHKLPIKKKNIVVEESEDIEKDVEKEMKEAVSEKVLNDEIDVNTGNMDEIVERVKIALKDQIQEIAS